MERDVQGEKHEVCRERDEHDIERKLVERTYEHREVLHGDSAAGGAQRRHERRRDRDAGDEGRRFLLARVAEAAGKAAGEGDEDVPDRGARVRKELVGLYREGRHQEVDRGRGEADGDLNGKAEEGVAEEVPVRSGHGIRDGEDRPHERADEHGSHDALGRVGVEPDRGDEHGDDEDAEVRAVQSGVVDEASAYGLIAGTALAHVEETRERAAYGPHASPLARARLAFTHAHAIALPYPRDVLPMSIA